MEEMKWQSRREQVRDFMQINPDARRCDILTHFKKEGMKERTINRYITRIREGWNLKKINAGGKPKKILTPKIRQRLVDMFDGENNINVK